MNRQILHAGRRVMLRSRPTFSPTVSRRYAGNYSRITKQMTGTLALYFPVSFAAFGWPLPVYWLVDFFGI